MDTTTPATITEYHQITFDEYLSAKQEIATRLRNMADDYIAVGYLLRRIEESEAYLQDGFKTLSEFAKSEYGMSESSVSRYIRINKEFSKDGYSKELSSEYIGYGVSKLSELLNIPEDDRKLVTVGTTVAQIRDLKEFNREEEQMAAEQIPGQCTVEDTIAAYENGEFENDAPEIVTAEVVEVPVNTRTYNDLETVLIDFFKDKPDLLNEIYTMSSYEDIVEKINPSGNKTHRYKIYMLFFYGYGDGVILKKMAAGNTNYSWPDVIQTIVDIYKDTYTDHDTVHQNFYNQKKPMEEPNPAGPQAAAVGEYNTPHPESVISLCYSCTEYETCNVKTGTCTKCDQYNDRAEAHKTEEQKYDEEQARIDKETAKKLQEIADKEKMEKLPSQTKETHEIKLGTELFADAISNKRSFELRPISEEYKEGDLVELIEYSNAAKTGRTVTKIVTSILEDVIGLDDSYCIISLAPVDEDGTAAVYADIGRICNYIDRNSNGYTKDNEEYILTEDAVGYVKLGVHR